MPATPLASHSIADYDTTTTTVDELCCAAIDLTREIRIGYRVWAHLQREIGRSETGEQRLRLMIAPVIDSSCLAVYVETARGGDVAVIGTIPAREADRMHPWGGESYIRRQMRDDGIRALVCDTLHTTVDELCCAAAANG